MKKCAFESCVCREKSFFSDYETDDVIQEFQTFVDFFNTSGDLPVLQGQSILETSTVRKCANRTETEPMKKPKFKVQKILKNSFCFWFGSVDSSVFISKNFGSTLGFRFGFRLS